MKPKTTPEQAVPPKRRVSKWEKEWKKTRIIVVLVIVVILVAGGIVGYGIYDKNIKPWHEPVVKVNGQVFDMNYYVKMMRLYGAKINPSQITQISQNVISNIQINEVVRQKAEEYGIYADDITDEEIVEKIHILFGFDPEGELSEQDFNNQLKEFLDERDTSRSDLEKMAIVPIILQEKLYDAMGNEEYPEGSLYNHVRVKAVLAGTREEAQEVIEAWDGDFNQIVKDFSPSRYYPQGGYWLVMVYEPEDAEEQGEEGLYIKAILLATEEKANDVAGEFDGSNFDDLATTYSLDSSSTNSGDMGWMSLDSIETKFGDLESIQDLQMNTLSAPISQNYPDVPLEWLPAGIESSAFDEFVFAEGSETSGVSDPVRDTSYTTQGGYWLVMVYEPEDAVEQEEEGLYIKAILVDDRDKADEVAGEFDGSNFADLAATYSLDSSSTSGGDMGWMSLDDIESEFGEDYIDDIQNLATNTLSDIIPDEDVSKQSGYWVIEVLDREDRTLIEKHRDSYISEHYSEWLKEELQNGKDEGRIKDYLEDDPDKLEWAVDHL